jgi:hypothetical protein
MTGITDCAIKATNIDKPIQFIQADYYSQKGLILIPMEWLGWDWFIIMGLISI